MGDVWVKEFTGGLDTRRMPEAAAGGLLVKAENGHITRGGEFEKRYAFVDTYTLEADQTKGLFATRSGLLVFGHEAEPTMPAGVSYQRIEHPDNTTALSKIKSAELFQGKVYVVAEFADGGVYHFYDGVQVDDWFDGRARASFTVGGSITAAISASGSFEVTGGTLGAGNEITAVTIDEVNLLGAPVSHTGSNATTAEAIADEINGNTTSPNYSATSDGALVEVTAANAGTGPNGKAITTTATGDLTTGNAVNMSGGAAATEPRIEDIKVNGISIISSAVNWSTSNTTFAAAVAAAINGHTSSPNYDSSSDGNSVNVIAEDAGSGPNGYVIEITTADGLAITPSSGLALADGQDTDSGFEPGSFVKTIGAKMYSVSGSLWHYSGIKEPTGWTTDVVGAGFADLSTYDAGSEELVALGKYQNSVAVFAKLTIQVWYVDPDPSLNRIMQTLANNGTSSPHSVTQFGDSDLFYLDESGVRSLRARESINIASTTDIGVPVDDLVTAKLDELTEAERELVYGLIEPKSGRFWLIMKDTVFVFSFFGGVKISAWTTYALTDDNGSAFEAESVAIYGRRVYIRSGDKIYCYGGVSTGKALDETVAEAWSPFLDANDPSRVKTFDGFDAAVRGQWEIGYALDPTEADEETISQVIAETTYKNGTLPLDVESTHISLRFRSQGSAAAKLAAFRIGYVGDADDD